MTDEAPTYQDISAQPAPAKRNFPGPWPWWALLAAGVGLTGFFAWCMVCWALWAREKRSAALGFFGANLALFYAILQISVHVLRPEWQVTLFSVSADLAWTLAAMTAQRRLMGPAPPRYANVSVRDMAPPLAAGAVLGFCAAVLFSMPGAIESRIEMLSLWDSLNREIVLWDFFRNTLYGLGAGLVVGLWWAGNPGGFRTRDIVVYFSAAIACTASLALLFHLRAFLVTHGADYTPLDADSWALTPSWAGKENPFLDKITNFSSWLALLILPLFFGSPSRFRDFAKRALVIPLAFACSLPFWMTDSHWWQFLQNQIVHELSSPDAADREQAHQSLAVLLARYPDHAKWPSLAKRIASHLWQNGRSQEAMGYYREIVKRFSGENQWCWETAHAKAIVDHADPALRNPEQWLSIPVVDHETYLTANWMCLLSAIRWWEGGQAPESQLKTRLRDLSGSQDRIELHPLPNLAYLDDAARNLGYDVLILPADPKRMEAFLEQDIPVVHQAYHYFILVYGWDKSRSTLLGYNFARLSRRVMDETREEAEEMLGLEEEGQGASRLRNERIRNQAYCEMNPALWQEQAGKSAGPFMAVVYPPDKAGQAAQAAGAPLEELKRQSNAALAALIALNYIRAADPENAVLWAETSSRLVDDPLPLYAAHLAAVLWKNREMNAKSAIRIQDRFSELRQVDDFMSLPENKAYLERAALAFEAGLESASLPWTVTQAYLPMLHENDPEQLASLVKILENMVALDPARSRAWARLAEVQEYAGNTPGMVKALAGLVSAWPADDRARLREAYGLVLMDDPEGAEKVLEKADPKAIRHEADYQFVQGAIAEWKDDQEDAMEHYAAAVDMRRHKPVYHLRYGKLLLARGRTEEARKTLEWAARIDADGAIRKEAQTLLETMGHGT